MKKILFSLFALFLTIVYAYSQKKEYSFRPQWKVGDKKTAIIMMQEKEYENGELTSDTTSYMDSQIEIQKEDKENYYIQISYENIALRSAIQLYEKMGEELEAYKVLKLKYKVSKTTGKNELTNWKEAQSFVTKSFDEINKLLDKKAPEMAGFSQMIFTPVLKIFESKENIEAYMNSEIGYLLFPFDKKLTIDDTLKINDSAPNPFMPTDTISATTLTYLGKVDEAKGIYEINSSILMDFTDFKNMMKEMMKGMAKSFGVEDSIAVKKNKELDDIEFNMTNLQVISYDSKTSWPVKVIRNADIIVKDLKSSKKKEIRTTITFK